MNSTQNTADDAPLKLSFSVFTSHTGPLTKVFHLNPDGTLGKADTEAQLTKGHVKTMTVNSLEEFAAVLDGLNHHQAVGYGVCESGDTVIESRGKRLDVQAPPGTVFRTRHFFNWPTSNGIMMIDYDPPKSGTPLSRDELWKLLCDSVPALADAQALWRPSASSCIYTMDGRELRGIRGQRFYVIVNDAADIPRAGEVLSNRLWLAGHGHVEVSASGGRLPRTIIDSSVFQPERLDFAAGAQCGEGLVRDPPAAERYGGGGVLDTSSALPQLKEGQIREVERCKAAARDAKRTEAAAAREAWAAAKALELAKRQGISEDAAREVLRHASGKQTLLRDFMLKAQDGTWISVNEVLTDRAKYDGGFFYDPLDPDEPNPKIAVAHLNDGRPRIWSFKHGGTLYRLQSVTAVVSIPQGGMMRAVIETLGHMRDDGGIYAWNGNLATVDNFGKLRVLSLHAAKQEVESLVSFTKYDGRSAAEKPADCPDELMKRVQAMVGHSGLRQLAGVVDAPTMDASGRVIGTPGYDVETGLLLVNPSGGSWPIVPDRPTREQVLEALQTLWRPFAKFPWKGDVDRGIHLAALLTAAVRRGLPTAPAFMYGAPTKGTGKTLAAQCVVTLGGGASAMAWPGAEVEIHKTLVSVLRAGRGVAFFDNVVGSVRSPALDLVLTGPEFDGRILGVSETTGPMKTNMLMVFTGNNARPEGDTCRRMLVAYMDADRSDPYTRTFDFDPLQMTRTHRIEMIVAALTILRGWITSGSGRVLSGSLGSFAEWDGLVRQCVGWVGQIEDSESAIGFEDPIKGIHENLAADPEEEALKDLLEMWHKSGELLSARKLMDAVTQVRRGENAGGGLAILAVIVDEQLPRNTTSSLGLGRWLGSRKNRVVEVDLDEGSQSRRWRLKLIQGVNTANHTGEWSVEATQLEEDIR